MTNPSGSQHSKLECGGRIWIDALGSSALTSHQIDRTPLQNQTTSRPRPRDRIDRRETERQDRKQRTQALCQRLEACSLNTKASGVILHVPERAEEESVLFPGSCRLSRSPNKNSTLGPAWSLDAKYHWNFLFLSSCFRPCVALCMRSARPWMSSKPLDTVSLAVSGGLCLGRECWAGNCLVLGTERSCRDNVQNATKYFQRFKKGSHL